MARTELQTGRRAQYLCPDCKHPVATVLVRHKTLGIVVPLWGPGPCHRTGCRSHGTGSSEASRTVRRTGSVGR